MSQDQNATAFHFLMVKVTEPFLLSPELEEESFFPDMIGRMSNGVRMVQINLGAWRLGKMILSGVISHLQDTSSFYILPGLSYYR